MKYERPWLLPWMIPGPIEQWRIMRLLQTPRPAPSSPNWDWRVQTLQRVQHHAIPGLVVMLRAEAVAMWEDRREAEHLRAMKARAFQDEDEAAMLSCEMRDPSVRGLDRREITKRRVCFLCGKPIPKRRQSWCSDAHVWEWLHNHEWSSARAAAISRDKARCVRDPEHPAGIEVNHIVPRYGRGYHQGCHNHLTNLESLCHSCHLIETAKQRVARNEVGPTP